MSLRPLFLLALCGWCNGLVAHAAGEPTPAAGTNAALSSNPGDAAPQPIVIFESLCQAIQDNYPMLGSV